MIKKKSILLTFTTFLFFIFLFTSCIVHDADSDLRYSQSTAYPAVNPLKLSTPGTSVTTAPVDTKKISIWIDTDIRNQSDLEKINLPESFFVEDREEASFWIEKQSYGREESKIILEDFYILSVPFINLTKNVMFEDLEKIWSDKVENIDLILWIHPEAEDDLQIIFNREPGNQVVFSVEQPESCVIDNCWRVMNFSHSDPEWKIITIDGQSPLTSNFDVNTYKLVKRIFLNPNTNYDSENNLPFLIETSSNFDQSLLTSVLMTGTTALVRNTAYQIEQFGVDFPIRNLRELFDSVDIIHVSNEVPFYSLCPPAVPVRKEMRFCSDPAYIETLKLIGVDVVELTGNHLLDWGPEAFLETLVIYEENGIDTYGGGRTSEDAEEPLIIEHNGNKIALLGCNLPGPENNWVTNDRPGSLPCNLDELQNTIIELSNQGINPIFTFQHNEFNTFRATQKMREDFWKMANAGAVIVSGSQAHYPQGIDFVNSTFIHYGLGNFLFDQMYTYWGMATIDVHYFYNNQYINTHQYPIINENFGQPRLMNEEEAELLFEKIYANSFYYQAENP
ncbi:MAG: CapA family protein [Anaerolineaceae bacterium]|nr:CapA family protein [Anaerolineaceae bacterium]